MKFLLIIAITLLTFSSSVFSQNRKNYFPIWTFHKKNVNIHGVSLGLWTVRDIFRNTNTNGIKIELIGLGIAVGLISESPVAQNDTIFQMIKNDGISERINGVSISALGTVCDCKLNGIAINGFGQIEYEINGVSAAAFMNFSQIHRGVQIGFINESYITRGLQFGFFNQSHNTKGIQIGIWNVNEKRKLPLINWNFKKRKK